MTSKRRIKKEIDYIVSDLILDCFTYTSRSKNPDDEAATLIISETLTLRNQLRNQVNHPERKGESVSSKAYYDELARSLVGGVDAGYEKLEKLIKK